MTSCQSSMLLSRRGSVLPNAAVCWPSLRRSMLRQLSEFWAEKLRWPAWQWQAASRQWLS